MVTIIFRMRIREGKEDEAIAALEKMCAAVDEKEPRTLAYVFHRLPDDANQLVLYESYVDDEDLQELMGFAHVRWVIERFYQDGKGELGLDDYEGRLWPGLHRHLALVMLAHCYLTLRQSYGPQESLQRSPPAAGGDPTSCPAPSAAAFPP